ncbi:MAG TPA: GTPase Era [Thermoanaerobaculaceae bacterium]|nr:GTPase Era [Thermoanaerobaculaceae bacterium]
MTHAGTVALLGRPNAGKSTLVNALMGQKVAIVSRQPQTTRHRITGVLTKPRGQMVLFDLPGVHKPLHRLNAQMMHVVRETLAEVDVVVQVFDAAQAPGAGEQSVLELLEGLEAPAVLVPNKVDLAHARRHLEQRTAFYAQRHGYAAVCPVSARTGAGVAELEGALFNCLPEGEPWLDPELGTTQSERFFVAELIREAMLARVSDELPFQTAVHLRHFEEQEAAKGPLLRLFADLVVERESQKGILVGARGATIKAIGTAARRQIEKLLGARVYLDLRVTVHAGWREDPRFLAELAAVEATLE